MSTIVISGIEISVELSDEGGAPVVQLHGLSSSRGRDRVLNMDLGRGLSGTRLLRYDTRGHGASGGRTSPGDYRWPVLADDLLQLLDKVFPGEPVHGVGPSMGAATLLHAAVREPERFRGLTLMVPPTAWATRRAQAENYRRSAELIEAHGVHRFLAAARSAPSPAAVADPQGMPEIAEHLIPSVYRGAGRSDLPDPATIAGLDLPVTILAWVDDPGHPLSTAQTLAHLLPQAVLHIARTAADVATWPGILSEDVARSAALPSPHSSQR